MNGANTQSGLTLPTKPCDKEINTDPLNTLRCLSSFDLWCYFKKLNILKVIKALKKIKKIKVFKKTNAINISRQSTSVWFKGSCAQFKNQVRTSLYQGAKQCQKTLLLEQLVGVSPAFNATPSQRELASNAEHLPPRERPSADFMVGRQQAPRPKMADSVAARLRRFMVSRPAKCEPNELKACVGFVL